MRLMRPPGGAHDWLERRCHRRSYYLRKDKIEEF